MFDYDAYITGLAEKHSNYPEYKKTFERVADDKFEIVRAYNDGSIVCDIEDANGVKFVYSCIDEYVEDGLVKFEVYEIMEEVGYGYGDCEEDYWEEVIEDYGGKLIYSKKF